MKKDNLRAVIYTRVSTEEQVEDSNSLLNQENFFIEHIEKEKDMKLYKIYSDEGITGTSTEDRDEFNFMIDDAKSGLFDIIFVKNVSRFARNTLDSIYYTRKLKKDYSVDVVFLLDNVDTRNDNYEFLLAIMASVAQQQSEATSVAVKNGQIQAFKSGVVFGRDMLGYRITEDRLNMIIVEEEAEIVRLIYYKYLNEKKGTHVIARELNDSGIKPFDIDSRSKSKFWSNITILRILKNGKYKGANTFQNTYTPDFLTHKKKYNKGNLPYLVIEDHHEPIIDKDTWEKTQKEIEKRSPDEETKKRYSNRYWYSGIIKCSECGGFYTTRKKKQKNGIYHSVVCAKSQHEGSKRVVNNREVGCTNVHVNIKVLNQAIDLLIDLVEINKDIIKENLLKDIENIKSVKNSDNKKDRILTKIRSIERNRERLLEMRIAEEITADYFKKNDNKNEKELKEQQDKLKDIEKEIQEEVQEKDDMLKYINRIDELLNFKGTTEREELYGEVVKEITVSAEKTLDIILNCLPDSIKLKFETSGKAEYYKIDLEIVEK